MSKLSASELPNSNSTSALPMIEADQFWSRIDEMCVLDVRSPSEFDQGHVPGATNLPLFDDAERAEVGTIYKNSGRDAAVLRGLKHAGQKMADLVVQARNASQGSQSVLVHCWRGGMRSQSVAWLLNTAGMNPVTLKGGYKAYRRLVRQRLDQPWPLFVISGLTGAGKTRVLHLLAQAGEDILDLEGLAHHRGSAFGGISQPVQPSTEHFENLLFESVDKMRSANRIWVEDEGNRIGTVVVPNSFHYQLRHAPAIFLDSSARQRVQNLMLDYGDLPIADLENSIQKIRKRLGFQHADEAINSLHGNNVERAIEIVLEYYDKTYLKAANSMPREDMPKLAIDELSDPQIVEQMISTANRQCANATR